MHWYFWIGLIASVAISIFTLPQLINLIKTKNTAFINIPMYLIYLIGCFCFLIGGILFICNGKLSAGLPLVIAQSICAVISTIIFVWKLVNYFNAKKNNMTETEYLQKQKGGQ